MKPNRWLHRLKRVIRVCYPAYTYIFKISCKKKKPFPFGLFLSHRTFPQFKFYPSLEPVRSCLNSWATKNWVHAFMTIKTGKHLTQSISRKSRHCLVHLPLIEEALHCPYISKPVCPTLAMPRFIRNVSTAHQNLPNGTVLYGIAPWQRGAILAWNFGMKLPRTSPALLPSYCYNLGPVHTFCVLLLYLRNEEHNGCEDYGKITHNWVTIVSARGKASRNISYCYF